MYPATPQNDSYYIIGQHKVKDEYLWLENKSSQTENWIAAQNNYTSEWFSTHGFSIPNNEPNIKSNYHNIEVCHGYLYASRVSPQGSMDAVILDKSFNEIELIMGDETLSGRMRVYSVSPSPINKNLVALSVIQNDEAALSMILWDNAAKRQIYYRENVYFFRWAPDGSKLYFSEQKNSIDLKNINYVYSLNPCTNEEELLYTEIDHAVFISLEVSCSGDLFIHVCLDYSSIRLLWYDPISKNVFRISENDNNTNYFAGKIDNNYYIYTNANAPRGKLIAYKDLKFNKANEIVILNEADYILQGVGIAGNKIFAVILENASNIIKVYDKKGGFIKQLDLPGGYGLVDIYPESPLRYSFGSNMLLFGYQSFSLPPSIICYNLLTDALSIVYCDHKSGLRKDIEVKQQFIKLRDGTQTVIYMAYRKDLLTKNKTPTLIYGYGGFGSVMGPMYKDIYMDMDIVDWVDQGGLYVLSILRGGGEYGQDWHKQGSKLNKKNTFFDFLDITEWLIDNGWTCPEKIAINGGSNGALLVTTVANMRPDLFKVAIASNPVTDMIRFSFDERAGMYITEFGNPRIEEYFEYIMSYSPYQNVNKKCNYYPAIYIQAGKHDNNAPSYHATKFVAKIQSIEGGIHPCLLRLLETAGHDLGVGEEFKLTKAERLFFVQYHLKMI